jgi:hypothetical protein
VAAANFSSTCNVESIRRDEVHARSRQMEVRDFPHGGELSGNADEGQLVQSVALHLVGNATGDPLVEMVDNNDQEEGAERGSMSLFSNQMMQEKQVA